MCKDSPHFAKYDDYYTTELTWSYIMPYVKAKNYKTIYEACMLNSNLSKSPEYWQKSGFNVIYNTKWDFLKHNEPKENYDIIITNPPFDLKYKLPILKKLVELDKPFIIILNVMNVFAKYFQDIFKDKENDLEIIYPNNRLHYGKLIINENGEKSLEEKKNTSFYSVFIAYKVNLNIKMLDTRK